LASPTDPQVVAQLLAFFEETSDLVGVSDESGNVRYINPAARKRLGIPEGVELATADFFPPEAFAQYYDEIRPQLLSSGTWNGLLPILNESGGSMMTFASISADIGVGGEILGVVTYARELSRIPVTGVPDVEPTEELVALVLLRVTGIDGVDARFGPDTVEVVFRALEQRVLRMARVNDRVIRVADNEFAIIFRGIRDTAHALRLGHNVRAIVLATPVPAIGGDIQVGIEVGVAIGDHDAEVADLVRRADAMRLATLDLSREMADIDEPTISELRVAISQGEVRPYVQPVHDLLDGALIGYEGLARWHHPKHGVLEPDAYAGIAAESSVGPVIDLQVARATAEAATLASREVPLRVYAPVSTRLLGDVRAEQHLREIAAAFSLSAARMCAQLSCRRVDPHAPTLASMLRSLRESGLRVALTDVESAADVHEFAPFNFDEIHCSRNFTRAALAGARDDAFEAIQAAHDVCETVRASGIESAVQRDIMVDLGCHLGSGSLFGVPVAADSVE
jgi:diguanylate cyclase